MTATMPQNTKEERLRWVLPIIRKKITLKDCANVFPHGKRTLERWVAAYKKHGEAGLKPQSTRPKTHPQETPIHIKERIIALRRKEKLCALKLKWKLEKEGIFIHERTIGKILKDEGLVRKYRKKKVKYKYIKAERQPGELVEIDVKHVPGKVAGKQYFQYTAIDTASRWRYLEVYELESTHHAVTFLKTVMEKFPYPIQAIKTDNHSTFTNYYVGTNKRSDMTVKTVHTLDRFCAQHNIVHYLIDPGKPAQNGTVERSHREDEEKFYQQNTFKTAAVLKRKLRQWNNYYNDLEHCGLDGKTPNEMLQSFQVAKPPNVYS